MKSVLVCFAWLFFFISAPAAAFASFQDNGDGTVTDSETGLIWQKTPSAETKNWQDALAACTDLSLAGKSDWRLPNRNELQSIVDYRWHHPAIDSRIFPNVIGGNFWTSTTDTFSSPTAAYAVDFNGGAVSSHNKAGNAFQMLAVRGGSQAVPEETFFQDNQNGTVTDSRTGLVWLQAPLDMDNDGASDALTWQAALAGAAALDKAGFTDWRLPNRNELQSIVDYRWHHPAIDSRSFPNVIGGNFWTSTTDTFSSPAYAYAVDFTGGAVSSHGKAGNSFQMLVVRGGVTAAPHPSFFYNNGDGTVTDSRTGLVWLQAPLDADNDGNADTVTWQEALAKAVASDSAGFTDWRLPNRNELQSIVDYRWHHPAIDSRMFPNVIGGNFWTSTTDTFSSPAYAYAVDFTGGAVSSYDKAGNSFQVLVVRGEQTATDTFPLTLTFAGTLGRVISNPPGMDCTANCTHSFLANTEVTLTAYDTHETAFSSWTNCPNPDGNVCTVMMDQARSVAANYISTKNQVVVTVTAPAGGSFHHGDTVTIQWTTEGAKPDDAMTLAVKRDSASDMISPDGENYYRFDGTYTNDGSEVVTLPDSLLNANDWRFIVTHKSSYSSGVSNHISILAKEETNELYIDKIGTGSGIITSNIAGVSCGIACLDQTAHFSTGETITLTATAANCSKFIAWHGCDNTSGNECTVTLNENTDVLAEFDAGSDAVALWIDFLNTDFEQGQVTSPDGFDCRDVDPFGEGTCRAKYCRGDTVTLTAFPADGVNFNGWVQTSGSSPCDSTSGNSCTIILPSQPLLRVTPQFFHPGPYNLSMTFNWNGDGEIVDSAHGIICRSETSPNGCSKIFTGGETVTLTAKASEGFAFSHWEGPVGSNCNGSKYTTCTLTMDTPRHVKAVFVGEDLGITVRADADILSARPTTENPPEIEQVPVNYTITVTNYSDTLATALGANITISSSVVGIGGEEAVWECANVAAPGHCIKTGANTFNIALGGGRLTADIKGTIRYGSLVNTGSVQAMLSISGKDSNPDNNISVLTLHRDPATLEQVIATEVMLNYLGGRPSSLADRSSRNTLVLTHGWQSKDEDECAKRQGRDRLACRSRHLWTGINGRIGQASALVEDNYLWTEKEIAANNYRSVLVPNEPNAIRSALNIIQYVWDGAYSQSGMDAAGYIRARRNVYNAGIRLGQELLQDLGSTYTGKIHFIGHSLGTAVNAYAIRHLLDNNFVGTIQMTILDHPNRVDRIGVGGINGGDEMSADGEKRWGFDHNFFATVLPEMDKDEYKDKLFVDNYFAEGTFEDSKISTAGVGTAISGKYVYNHLSPAMMGLARAGTGLRNPNNVGQELFKGEDEMGVAYNDHSGVHQWYRWTMWPSSSNYLSDVDFVCNEDGNWIGDSVENLPDLLKSDDSETLRPCGVGFAYSILLGENNHPPLEGGLTTRPSLAAQYDLFGGSETQRCVVEMPRIYCSEIPPAESEGLSTMKASKISSNIDTDLSYALFNIELHQSVNMFSFDYRIDDTSEDDEVFLLIDGTVAWGVSTNTLGQGKWQESGKVPFYIKGGNHSIMLVFNNKAAASSFELQNLEFFQDPDTKKSILPAVYKLLLRR